MFFSVRLRDRTVALGISVREFRGARQHIKDSHSWVTIASQDTPNQAASDDPKCALVSGLASFGPVGQYLGTLSGVAVSVDIKLI